MTTAGTALWPCGAHLEILVARWRERYLASRKEARSGHHYLAGNVLRWHPGIGAMLALFTDIRTDEPRAICRTFLDHEGRKIERKF